MTTAEHIVRWAENSQPHWRRLRELSSREYLREGNAAQCALTLALQTVEAMVAAGALERNGATRLDLVETARLMLKWREEK